MSRPCEVSRPSKSCTSTSPPGAACASMGGGPRGRGDAMVQWQPAGLTFDVHVVLIPAFNSMCQEHQKMPPHVISGPSASPSLVEGLRAGGSCTEGGSGLRCLTGARFCAGWRGVARRDAHRQGGGCFRPPPSVPQSAVSINTSC